MAKDVKEEKVSFLKQEFSLDTIKNLFSKSKDVNQTPVFIDNSANNYIASAPEVNILPENVHERYSAEDLRKKYILIAASILGVFLLLWGVSWVVEGINNKKVADITSSTAAHNQEASNLKGYSGYRTDVETKRSELASKMSTDINVGKINKDFSAAATAAGYQLTSITLSLNGDGGGSCVNPDPFTPAEGIGCINFNLAGNGNMGQFFEILNKPKSGFVNVYVPNALSSSESGNSIDGSTSVTQEFYTHKYDSLNQPLDSVLNPPAKEAK